MYRVSEQEVPSATGAFEALVLTIRPQGRSLSRFYESAGHGMPLEQELTEFPSRIALLQAAERLELLKQSREEIAKLEECGRSRPSWQPKCSGLAHDEDVLLRL